MNGVVSLVTCMTCKKQYVMAPDPFFPGQWVYFNRAEIAKEQPTHISIGTKVCISGHQVKINVEHAAMTESGKFINVGPRPADQRAN